MNNLLKIINNNSETNLIKINVLRVFGKTLFSLFGCLMLISVCCFSSSVYARESVFSRRDLEVALESAVRCIPAALENFDGSKIDGGANDSEKNLRLLGVNISNEAAHGGELRYQFPAGIKVFGHEVNDAIYFDQSTTLFFVRLRPGLGSLQLINKTLKLHPLKKEDQNEYGYFGEFIVHFISKSNLGNDSPANVVFSGAGSKNGKAYIVIGCQNIAW